MKQVAMQTPANDPSVHTEAHQQLFNLAYRAAVEVDRVIRKHLDNIIQWLQVQYGDTPPTYEQFWDDRDALKAMAKERGLKDDQSVRKPYNSAVRQLYGDKILEATGGRSPLPVSTSKEAVAKRLVRPAPAPRATSAPDATAAPRTFRLSWPADAKDAVKMLLDHYGFAALLTAFSSMLAEHKEMAQEAKRIEQFALRRTHQKKIAAKHERRVLN